MGEDREGRADTGAGSSTKLGEISWASKLQSQEENDQGYLCGGGRKNDCVHVQASAHVSTPPSGVGDAVWLAIRGQIARWASSVLHHSLPSASVASKCSARLGGVAKKEDRAGCCSRMSSGSRRP